MKKQYNFRGMWPGIPLEYLRDGYTYSDPQLSPDGNYLAYLMSTEFGAQLFIMDLNSSETVQLTSQTPLSTGTAYGGGRYCWSSDSKAIIFTSKGQLYSINVDGSIPEKLPSFDKSFAPYSFEEKTVFSVEHEDRMSLAYMENNWPQQLVIDEDFMYDGKINPKTGDIILHTWSFPSMSWNRSKIILLEKENNWGPKIIAGGDNVATSQPTFSPDGNYITFHSDKNGWLNLWITNADGSEPEPLVEEEAEHAYSTWVTGNRNYVWTEDSKYIIYTRYKNGFVSLHAVDLQSKEIYDLHTDIGNYSSLSLSNNLLTVVFSNHSTRDQVLLFEIKIVENIKLENKKIICLSGVKIPNSLKSYFIAPKEITFPTTNGMSHALLYTMDDEDGNIANAPTIFLIHGGPTGMHLNKFHDDVNYFVSRGWHVVAVNHRGSIGYGREYRESMNHNWGVHDVEDTKACFYYLKEQGLLNPDKCVIMGGSAGGYTTLMLLANEPNLMAAGVNLYGVSDLLGLSEETHFLESQYDTTLIGPLPKAGKDFFERSPVNIADKIIKPLLILQGADDPVVLKNQSDKIAELVKGVVEYKVYEGEGHGFRKMETIKDVYFRIDRFLRHNVLYK